MKQTRLFLLTCLLTFSAAVVVIYSSSCRKDKCKGVVCQNTAYCSGGTCVCPTGYTGARCEISTITYQNNSFTTLYITINGTEYTIPAGSATSFTGTAGSSVSVTNVHTKGDLGLPINWSNFIDQFPTNGDRLTEPFNVSIDYFFLKMRNVSTYQINVLFVNYATTAETYEFPLIPNDGLTYGIGYYEAYSNTEIRAEAGSAYWSWLPSIPYVENADVTLTAH